LKTSLQVLISSDSDTEEADSEQKWREKLAAEAEDEFREHVGKFHVVEEEEERTTFGQEESYDDWADRIYSAFSERRR
jgi:hypothetical protein